MISNTSPRMFNKYLLIALFFISTFNTNLFAQACNTPWNASTIYASPTAVSYNGKNYTSKWWTKNEQPGNPSAPWTDNGLCSTDTASI